MGSKCHKNSLAAGALPWTPLEKIISAGCAGRRKGKERKIREGRNDKKELQCVDY